MQTPQTPPANASAAAQVVRAAPEHLESLVDCHMAAMPQDYVPSLGRAFVTAHDRFYIAQPDGIVLVTLDPESGRVSGFILGGNPGVRGRFLRYHLPLVLGAILTRSLTNSRVRRHTLELLGDGLKAVGRKLGLVRPERDPIPDEPPGTWSMSIALGTHPDFRRDGAGKAIALLEGICAESRRLGFRTVRAMTATTNVTSHMIHSRLGWKVLGIAKDHYQYRYELGAPG